MVLNSIAGHCKIEIHRIYVIDSGAARKAEPSAKLEAETRATG